MMILFLYATSLFEPVDQQTNRHLGLAKYHFKKHFVSNMNEYPGGGLKFRVHLSGYMWIYSKQ